LAQRRRGAADPPLAVCGGFLRAGPDIGDACELDKQRIEPRALMRQQIGIALEDFHATTPVRRLPRMIAMPVRRTDHPLQMHDLLVGAMRREAKRRGRFRMALRVRHIVLYPCHGAAAPHLAERPRSYFVSQVRFPSWLGD
jgi:hypothetical protein